MLSIFLLFSFCEQLRTRDEKSVSAHVGSCIKGSSEKLWADNGQPLSVHKINLAPRCLFLLCKSDPSPTGEGYNATETMQGASFARRKLQIVYFLVRPISSFCMASNTEETPTARNERQLP